MIAIISARAESKRLPGKNKIDFFGKPMVRHIIERLLYTYPLIDEINVKTNDTDIYDYNKLRQGNTVDGPAVIEASKTTIVVQPGQKGFIDEFLNTKIVP